MKRVYKSGETVKVSGQAVIIGPKGKNTGREVTLVKGKTVPPVAKGSIFRLRDITKHKDSNK